MRQLALLGLLAALVTVSTVGCRWSRLSEEEANARIAAETPIGTTLENVARSARARELRWVYHSVAELKYEEALMRSSAKERWALSGMGYAWIRNTGPWYDPTEQYVEIKYFFDGDAHLMKWETRIGFVGM